MINIKGKLFVIEGTDGSGKATQSKMLVEKLKSEGFNVKLLDFPNYNSVYGKLIRKYLEGDFGNSIELDPYLVSVLYADDRRLQKDEIIEELEKGTIIIANRYVESNMAHQTAKLSEDKKEKFIRWLNNLEYELNGLPKSTKTFFLYLPLEYRETLMSNRKKLDGHELNKEYQIKAENQYMDLAKKEDWIIIDILKNNEIKKREEILEEIYFNILKLINL